MEALERLRAGNQRFVSAIRGDGAAKSPVRRFEPARDQAPLAIVLGCSDARVPAEIIFDQDLGDLFVIRVAGNVVAPSQIGSIEFAAERFGTRLVLVLGHSMCGAVQATIEELERRTQDQSPNLRSILDRIRPSVEALLETPLRSDADALMRHAVRANIQTSVDQLRQGSRILEELIRKDQLLVMGAEYSLETGVVDFLDDLPEPGSSIPAAARE
jgi:carbonic anhydrase